ncbi:MAG: tetratricopeptide repeat protein [Anaerolineae bacterium]
MSLRTRTEPTPAEDLALELALLCDALDMLESGAFLFAVCEEGPLRERLMHHVREHLAAQDNRDLIEVELSPDQPDLAGNLLSLSQSWERKAGGEGRPPVPARTAQSAERAARLLAQPERAGSGDATCRRRLRRPRGLFFFETSKRAPTAPPPMHAEVTVRLLDRFHRTLLPPDELRRRAALYERRLERELAAEEPHWPRIAFLCRDLANIHRELDDYARAEEFQRQAIRAYQEAIAQQEVEGQDEELAALQVWLGNACSDLPTGDRAENLARAIRCYEEALRFRTPEAAPLEYATTQNNLGLAYADLPTGDRAENLARAIRCYEEALRFYTEEADPYRHEIVARNLAAAAPPPAH